MEQKLTRIPVAALTALLAVAAYCLRLRQLETAFDEVGMIAGAGLGLLTWVSILAVLLFAVYSFFLRGRKKYASISMRSLPLLILSCGAALLLVISSILRAVNPQKEGDLLVAVGGVLTAACWIVLALFRNGAKRANPLLFLIPAAFYVVDLICQFRYWTRDPVILDYCFDLFALICTMCAMFHLGSFGFDKGERCATVFFTMSGIYFNAAAMAGAEISAFLSYLAALLWLFVNLWLLLRPGKRRSAEAA